MYKTRFAKNKLGAVKTDFNGIKYASKFEASIAQELELMKRSGEIKDYENQYKVYMHAYDENGRKALTVTHKIDFRVQNIDGTYTLIEAKGFETADYKMRRRWLEALWLPLHLDHTYEVVYLKSRRH